MDRGAWQGRKVLDMTERLTLSLRHILKVFIEANNIQIHN